MADIDGSAVVYDREYDPETGVWARTVARATVGAAAQMEVADWCPAGPRPTDELAAVREDHRRELASRAAAVVDAEHRAARIAADERGAQRATGLARPRGKRGGRRGRK